MEDVARVEATKYEQQQADKRSRIGELHQELIMALGLSGAAELRDSQRAEVQELLKYAFQGGGEVNMHEAQKEIIAEKEQEDQTLVGV